MAQQKTNILRYAIYGAIGFGIGGLIFGVVGLSVGGYIFGISSSLIFGLLPMGALGGLSLGLAMKLGRKKLLILALASGFVIALGPYTFVMLFNLTNTMDIIIGKYWAFGLIGLFTGALLGTLFAMVIDKRLILHLALYGQDWDA